MKIKILLRFLLTGGGFLAFLVGMALVFRPDDGSATSVPTPEAIAEAESLRATDFNFDDPPVINQKVDYSEGESADWFPKGEAPILAELVAEGRLPPVAERVGPEPAVMLGPDGLGTYGGTWLRGTNAFRNVDTFGTLYAYAQLVRWSPLGYPIVPHVAKSYEILDGGKTYVFKLRRGMRWSDGEPFTADDILYWWDYEAMDSSLGRDAAAFDFRVLQFRGKLGRMLKVDDYTLRVEFDEPNGIFLDLLATYAGSYLTSTPAHYLRKFHPGLGDSEFIREMMDAYQMPSPEALYVKIKSWDNVEHPRLWPFIYRTHKSNPPFVWVRNPYYYAVDPAGNQLPYLDRVQFDIKSTELLNIAASRGDFSLQTGVLPSNYTMMMEQREAGGYDVYHWTVGDGSSTIIFPNMNLRHDPDDPVGKMKVALYQNPKFRQALSLSINRAELIEVEFNGMSEAVQAGPGPNSVFHEPSQY
jgi:ABC-type transport system substrate-binding protein